MARAYPMELCERVVAAYHDGEGTFPELAERFRTGEATVNRWVLLERRTGSVNPRPRMSGGHNRLIVEEGEPFIARVFEDVPDTTIAELVEAYESAFGVRVGRSTMQRKVQELGFTRKKGVFRSPASQRADVVEAREAFVKAQSSISRCSLFFLDECAISTALNHRYGRSRRGDRVVLQAPTYGSRRTLVGAIAMDGRKALTVLDKGLRVPTFIEFVTDKLVPLLRPGDVVIMDNLRIHHNAEAIEAIEATGAIVNFQPPYSPEFNAIEFCWSWIKQELRRIASRSIETLVSCAKRRWDEVTSTLCRSWARGCGYAVS